MSEQIYVLRLQGNKFYVGKTSKPIEVRVAEHRNGRGSAWTRLHHVLGVESCESSNGRFDEDNKVRDLMAKYGIDAVRGGSYSQVDLDPETKTELEKQFRHANGECILCGRNGHFVKDCPRKRSAPLSCDEESDPDDKEADSDDEEADSDDEEADSDDGEADSDDEEVDSDDEEAGSDDGY